LPASSGQPTPEFAFAFNDIEVPPGQLLGVVRAGYVHSLFRAALGRMRPPNPGAKNHLIGRSMEWVVMRAGCRWSGSSVERFVGGTVRRWDGSSVKRVVGGAGCLRMPEASQPVAGRWSGSDTTGKLPPI
jgi:hypothetical protein